MFKIFNEKLDWHGLKLELETGKLARQADGAVISSLGELELEEEQVLSLSA